MERVIRKTCKYCKGNVSDDYYFTGYSCLPTDLMDKKKYYGGRFSYDTYSLTFSEVENRYKGFFCSRECCLIFMNKERLNLYFFYFLLGVFYIFLMYYIGSFEYTEYLGKGWSMFKNPFVYLGVIMIVMFVGHIILEYNRLLGYKEEITLYDKNKKNAL